MQLLRASLPGNPGNFTCRPQVTVPKWILFALHAVHRNLGKFTSVYTESTSCKLHASCRRPQLFLSAVGTIKSTQNCRSQHTQVVGLSATLLYVFQVANTSNFCALSRATLPEIRKYFQLWIACYFRQIHLGVERFEWKPREVPSAYTQVTLPVFVVQLHVVQINCFLWHFHMRWSEAIILCFAVDCNFVRKMIL